MYLCIRLQSETLKKRKMKSILIKFAVLLFSLNSTAATIPLSDNPPIEEGSEHKAPARLPLVDYDDNELTIWSPYIMYNVEIVIKNVYGSVLYYEALDELDYSYTFQLDEEDFNSMYSIELIYGDHHLYGYFESVD